MSGTAYYVRFEELEGVLGSEAASILVTALGGRKLYVRAKLPPDSPIIAAVGSELAEKFSAFIATGIGGLMVELPTNGAATYLAHRRRLRELAAAPNETEKSIATKLGVNQRTVRRMRAKLREERAAQTKSG